MPAKAEKEIRTLPSQKQRLPGSEVAMNPRPLDDDPEYRPSGKLEGKAGIGRAVAILFAKEGADVSIVYLNEHKDDIFGFIYMTSGGAELRADAAIIDTTSVQAYDPEPYLMDYACTKAAILNFTRSLAKELAERRIRVNAVAPGPIWTPLIPASFSPDHVARFGKNTLMKRPGQPAEVAPSFLFLACPLDSSYVTGQ